MGQFNYKIKTLAEVQAIYPNIQNIEALLKNSHCAKLVNRYNAKLIADEKFYSKKKELSIRKTCELRIKAEAKGLYHFLFCIENITETMVKRRRDPKYILVLINKMKTFGFDPWDVEKNTAALYFEKARERICKMKGITPGYEISDTTYDSTLDDDIY